MSRAGRPEGQVECNIHGAEHAGTPADSTGRQRLTRRDCLRLLAWPAVAAGLPVASSVAHAQAQAQAQSPAWPSKPLTLVVPWPAGNPSDAFARRLQPAFAKALGQPVIVDNVVGAGGTLGVASVMAQPADGHTVLVGTPTELMLSPLQMPAVRYSPQDFTMVGSFGRVVYVLVSRADLPQATLADLVALKGQAGAKPLAIGNIGPGSLIHLMSVRFEKVSGVPVTHIPYRGVPPMVQDVMGGQLDLAFLPLAGSTMATIEQGRLRALGITSTVPSPLFPALKTLAAGSKLFEGFDFDVWGGLQLRKETPPEILQRLNHLFYEAVQEPGFREWARSTGSDPWPAMSLAELQAFYPREVARYQALARSVPVTNN